MKKIEAIKKTRKTSLRVIEDKMMANKYEITPEISETTINNTYIANGVTFKAEGNAQVFLEGLGYIAEPGAKHLTTEKRLHSTYKNRVGKIARAYRLRTATLDTDNRRVVLKYAYTGFLVSFGGEPKSCYELKFTKIARPNVGVI